MGDSCSVIEGLYQFSNWLARGIDKAFAKVYSVYGIKDVSAAGQRGGHANRTHRPGRVEPESGEGHSLPELREGARSGRMGAAPGAAIKASTHPAGRPIIQASCRHDGGGNDTTVVLRQERRWTGGER
mgnify:CR=1 FL=1